MKGGGEVGSSQHTMPATVMACGTTTLPHLTSPYKGEGPEGESFRKRNSRLGTTHGKAEGPEFLLLIPHALRFTHHASRIKVAPDFVVVLGFSNLNEGRFCGFTVVHDFRAAGVESAAGGRVEGTRDVT